MKHKKLELMELIKDFTPILGDVRDYRRIREDIRGGLYQDRIDFEGDDTEPWASTPASTPGNIFWSSVFLRYVALGCLSLSGYGIYNLVKDLVDLVR